MLIRHPRQTDRDIEAWALWEREDAINASLPRMQRLEDLALSDMARFAASGPCWVGTSWGKESIIVAHMAARLRGDVEIPVVWFPATPCANPDSATVRDTFLAQWSVAYHEHPSPHVEVAPGRWERDRRVMPSPWDTWHAGHPRHVLGLRAEENKTRELRMRRWGVSTANTCAPLGFWRAADVFAYHHRHGLPTHPAYACSMGGLLDRARIRVDDLGGEEGTGWGRAGWERRYYGREIDAASAAAKKMV